MFRLFPFIFVIAYICRTFAQLVNYRQCRFHRYLIVSWYLFDYGAIVCKTQICFSLAIRRIDVDFITSLFFSSSHYCL